MTKGNDKPGALEPSISPAPNGSKLTMINDGLAGFNVALLVPKEQMYDSGSRTNVNIWTHRE